MFHNFHLNFVSLVPFLVYCILCNYPLTPADIFTDSTDRYTSSKLLLHYQKRMLAAMAMQQTAT